MDDFRFNLNRFAEISGCAYNYSAQAYGKAMDDLLASIQTGSDAQKAYDALMCASENACRIMGNHVADNATDSAYHPEESEGCAYLVLDDDSAIWAEWDSYGFWYVTVTTQPEAYKQMEAKALEYEISEEYDADSDETHWAQ